ncbi:MAG: thiamine pyrophosphate-dependent enzyme, partial [Halobacteriaceae archaeon]
VETLDVPVVTSYKGKGLVPEDDPRSVGVTASFLSSGARAVLDAADLVLALGTDFDGVTTGGWSLPMGDALVHVTLDGGAVGAAYEPDVAVVDDAATAARELRRRVDGPVGWDGSALGPRVRREYRDHLAGRGLLDPEASPAPTPAVLGAVREATPREATVVTDIGGHRLWALQTFRADGPHRYVTAGSWAGMGVGLPGALGAKLARPDAPVVCLHGDGGLEMCLQSLHTGAAEGLGVVCVVFADADYGIISKDPAIYDGETREFAWDAPDLAGVAENLGCVGERVDTAAAAGEAVADAVAADRDVPTLVEVRIDGDEPTVKDVAEYETALP